MTTTSPYPALEAQRKAAIKTLWLTIGRCLLLFPLVLAPAAAFVFLSIDHPPESAFASIAESGKALINPIISPVVLGCIVWFFAGVYLLLRYLNGTGLQAVWDYTGNYKTKVFNSLCEQHFPGLAYDPKGYVGYDEFDATRLFADGSDEYRCEDHFSGRINNTDVQFTEVVAKRERKYWREGQRRTHMETFFHGLVFVAEFHKHFRSTTRLIPRGEEIAKVAGQRPVTLEDPDYEDLFATLSTDHGDAFYVLSTSTAGRLVALNKRFPRYRALFKDDKLLLALPSERNLFEPSLYRRASSTKQLESFVADIKSILAIVQALDLDTRIWSKR